MWWETVLIAAIPSLIASIVAHWLAKRKYNIEINNLAIEGKSTENKNMQIILETYKVTLEQYKTEIEDANKRFADYIKQANKRAESMEKRLIAKDDKIKELEKTINIVLKEACFVKGCSKREYLKNNNGE